MITLPLQFRYSPHQQRATCARLIEGKDSERWLQELISWGVPLDTVQLYPIPRSRSDNACVGVLAAWHETALAPPSESSISVLRCQPYGCLAGRLYLPAQATCLPDLGAAELSALLGPSNTNYVWHPQIGLICYDPESVLSVVDLLSRQWPAEAAAEGTADWGWAAEGTAYPQRITSLRAAFPESVVTILADGRGDIGTQAGQLKSIPQRTLSFVKTAVGWALFPLVLAGMAVGRLVSMCARAFSSARTAQRANSARTAEYSDLPVGPVILLAVVLILVYHILSSGQIPSIYPLLIALLVLAILTTALGAVAFLSHAVFPGHKNSAPRSIGPGWLATLGGMLQKSVQNISRVTSGLLNMRQREMDRLMKLLRENPDEGLKYALPIAGAAPRGIAAPSGSLMQRLVDFQLSGSGGSGPADIWDLPRETELQLIQRYRELAAREVQLGRYRRAAYIYAELLGDHNAAASTLVSGRFYREAAILYRDKLKRPLDAARCLEEGGLILEAIELYRPLKMLEKVGDLHLRLEDRTAADAAYREALEALLLQMQYQAAASLLAHKLQAPDEALEVLDKGWRSGTQARGCLEASFSLLGKLGRHEQLLGRLAQIRQAKLTSQQVTDGVYVLSRLAASAAHARSRHVAADTVRVLASRALIAQRHQPAELTEAVARLAAEDRLLQRDCARAVEFARNPQRSSAKSKGSINSPRRDSVIRPVKTYVLPPGFVWDSACESDSGFYVVGYAGCDVALASGHWDDEDASVSMTCWNRFTGETGRALMCHSPLSSKVFLGSTSSWRFPLREIGTTRTTGPSTKVLTPAWLPDRISALAAAPGGTVYSFQLSELLLTGFSQEQHSTLHATLSLPILGNTTDFDVTYPMAARDDAVFLAVEEHLIEHRVGRATSIQTLNHPIRGLAVSPPRCESCVAVLFDEGGRLFHGAQSTEGSHLIANGLVNPHAVFLKNGSLVVHGTQGWETYHMEGKSLKFVKRFETPEAIDTLSLLRTGRAGQVARCTSGGEVRVHQIF